MNNKKEIEFLRKQLAERDEQLAERDAKLAEENKKLSHLMHDNRFLNELYGNGLGKLTFMKTVTEPTSHTSDHPKINKDVTNKKFSILSNIDEYIAIDKIEYKVSSFLNYCKEKNNVIQFADEEAIKTKLEMLFEDILNISMLDLEVSNGSVGVNFGETISSSKTGKLKKSQRPDYSS